MAKKYIAFFIVTLGFFLTQLNFSAYLPTLPVLTQAFNRSNQAIMLTLSMVFAGYAVGQLIWGTLSDYIGRRRVVLIALVAYALMSALVSTSHHYFSFCLSYIFAGLMAAAFTSVGNAIIRDLFVNSVAVTRAIATVGIFMSAGPLIGPLIGAHLGHWFGWRAVFIFLCLYSIVLFVGVLLFVPETQQQTNEKKHSPLSIYKKLLTNNQYIGYLLILGLMFGTLFSLLDITPFIYKNILNLSLVQSGRLIAVTTIGLVSGTVVVWFAVKRMSKRKLIASGTAFVLIGGGWLWSAAHYNFITPLSIALPLTISCFGLGFIVPATKGGAMTVFDSHAGCVASMMKFTQSTLCIIVISIFSFWHSGLSLYPLALLLILISLICGIIYTLTLAKPQESN